MAVKKVKRSILQRILGVPATEPPFERESWTYDGKVLVINLEKTRELSHTGGAARFEGRGLPERVLVVNGEDGRFHAYSNKCRHLGRRLDPVPGAETIQCCSVMKATYDYSGVKVAGPGRSPVDTYEIEAYDGRLMIRF